MRQRTYSAHSVSAKKIRSMTPGKKNLKKRYVIYERARFNQRKQQEGETVDSFVTSLYTLPDSCSY